MKKILLAAAMMLSLMACVKEVLPESAVTGNVEGEVTLSLSMIVPEAQVATKGTFSAPTITSLNVLVFDDKGYLVDKVPAKHSNGSDWTPKEVTVSDTVKFKVTLPKSGAPCHLHFVANADVSGVGFGLETDIMTNLTTSGTADAYWQVVKLPRLIDRSDLTSPIKLIRNFAKVTLVSSVKTFKPTGYALITYPKSGTVVPYNTSNADFQDCVDKDHADLTSAKYVAFQPAKVAYSTHNFEDAEWNADGAAWTALTAESATDNNSLKITGNPLYTYESTYGKAFLLVRGIFDQDGDGFGNDAVSYYKVDFYDEFLGNCDILRNIEYQFTIDNVVGHGYSSPGAAADPQVPAGNNISNSIKTQSLLNISDGKQKLSVEYTSKWVVSNKPFTLKYMFQPDKNSSTTVNTIGGPIDVTSAITDNYEGRTTSELSYSETDINNGYSTITVTPTQFPTDDKIYKEEITITSIHEQVKLSRKVMLYFKKAYTMGVECTTKTESGVTKITVDTQIPVNLPREIFPLVFDIEALKMSLYPDQTAKNALGEVLVVPVATGASLSGNGKNTFYYQRTLSLEEYDILGGHPDEGSTQTTVEVPTIFLPNMSDPSSTVYVRNDYFTLGQGSF